MLKERIHDTFQTHDRPWRNRAVWALCVYYYGVWSMNLRWRPWRWLTSKVYGLLSILSEIVTGVTIDRSMALPGKGLHIIHPTSVYLHPDVKLGARVGIMHNVCLGTNMRSDGAVPVIGDDVFIGTGASVLGKVKVGDGARIASDSLVINNAPPGAFAVGVPAKNLMFRSVRSQEKVRAAEDGNAESREPAERA